MNTEQKAERLAADGYDFNMDAYFSKGWELFKKMPLELVVYTVITFVIYGLISYFEYWGGLLSAAASTILGVGYFLAFQKADKGEKVGIADFFKSFDNFVQLFVLGVVVGVLTFIATLLLILPGIWFIVATIFAGLFVGLEKIGFWESIKLSIKVVNKRWFSFFIMMVLLALVNLAGAIALGVGLLVTVPTTYAILYASYTDIIGKARGMDTADHLVGDSL